MAKRPKPYISTTKVAHACGVSIQTVNRWIHEGTIQAYRLSPRAWRVNRASVLKFFKERGIDTKLED